MVPTSSPFADLSNTRGQNEAPEEDFYLHLNLPPELDLPLPATTQIYHQPPRSYLIPRWDLGPDSGAFTRIEFPSLGKGSNRVTQEDVDTFETILAQCTAFLERAAAPRHEKSAKTYNPAEYAPGEGYVGTGEQQHGQIVLVNEDDGSVVGELAEGANVVESASLKPGSKSRPFQDVHTVLANTSADPVEIQVSQDGTRIEVRPISEEYLQMARHPAYKDSSLVQNAAAASRLIVTGSSYISNMLASGAETFTQKMKPAAKPMTFKPTTHQHVRRINTFTTNAANVSAKTVGQATKFAQNIGAAVAGRQAKHPNGKPADYKPGLLNKSMIAFSTIADGIAHSGKSLLTTSSAAATTMVGHKYGPNAGAIAADLAGGVKNVGLVYIDVTGVSRRAVIKSVAKGMVVGKVKGGGDLVVGGGDGGVFNPNDLKQGGGVTNDNLGRGQAGRAGELVGFGNAAPSIYSSGAGPYSSSLGEPLEGSYAPEKKR
jgi:spartin